MCQLRNNNHENYCLYEGILESLDHYFSDLNALIFLYEGSKTQSTVTGVLKKSTPWLITSYQDK